MFRSYLPNVAPYLLCARNEWLNTAEQLEPLPGAQSAPASDVALDDLVADSEKSSLLHSRELLERTVDRDDACTRRGPSSDGTRAGT